MIQINFKEKVFFFQFMFRIFAERFHKLVAEWVLFSFRATLAPIGIPFIGHMTNWENLLTPRSSSSRPVSRVF